MSHNISCFAPLFGALLIAAGCASSQETTAPAAATATASSIASSSSTTGGGAGGSGGVGGAAEAGAGGTLPVPERLILTGVAIGTSTDMMETVTCDLEGELLDLVLEGDDIAGFFSGEFLRRVEVGRTAFQFEPLVAGPARVDRLGGNMAELSLVGDQPDTAKPYWLEIEVLSAEEVAPYRFEGTWSCAPLEIDGMPPDFSTTVTGTFELSPP
jgi:hypothetical protein